MDVPALKSPAFFMCTDYDPGYGILFILCKGMALAEGPISQSNIQNPGSAL
jgi:hypothetical protein